MGSPNGLIARLLPERRPRDRDAALGSMERIVALTHLVSSLEYLSRPEDRRRGGLNHWDITQRNLKGRSPALSRVLGPVSQPRATVAVHALRVGAALALLPRSPAGTRGRADAFLAASSAALYPRQHYGTDGSDQVSFLVSTATALARTGRNPRLVDICLWYVALQATLSYAVSGWAKLAGPAWRRGDALGGVMRTLSYGDPIAYKLISGHPRTARALGGSVLLMECSFPAVFLFRGRLAPILSAGALSFHVGAARLMGLGRFVTAFGAMHPAVLYVTVPQERTGPGAARRDDTLPLLSGLFVLGLLGAGVADQRRRRGVVARGRGDERFVTTSRGSTLAYRDVGPAGAGPTVVLEAGLGSPAEHWARVQARLGKDRRVVAYSRAGYGRSAFAGRDADFTLDAAAADLLELVDAVAPGGEVILVGHSLGGWIATLAAAQRPAAFAGLALVDSSHPAELERSSRQARSRQALTDSIALMPASLRLGMGRMLAPPDWAQTLPDDVRTLALEQLRDAHQWSAVRREWRVASQEFDAFDGQLPEVPLPLLVLTAGATALNDPVQEELHRELVAMSPAGAHEVIAKVDHLGVLTGAAAADRVVARLERFVAACASAAEEEVADVAR